MKRTQIAWLLLILGTVCSLGPVAAVADTIYLKRKLDNTIVGIIDNDSSTDQYVAIRTSLGFIKVPRSGIDRIDQQSNVSFSEASADLIVGEGDAKPEGGDDSANLDRALELYQSALANEPNNERLIKKIENTKQRIHERDQRSHGKDFAKIERRIKDQQYEEAIDEAKNLLALAKEESAKEKCRQLIAQSHTGIARYHAAHINYAQAEKHYNLAMQAYPDDPVARLELADIMKDLTPAAKSLAIPLYQQGIDLAKKKPGLMDEQTLLKKRFDLGRLYFEGKEYRKAADILLEVSRDDKEYRFPEAVDYAVDAYYRIRATATEEDIKDIIVNLQSIIALKPREDRAHFLLGRIYFSQGEWEKARDMMMAAVKNAPPTTPKQAVQEALYYLGICQSKTKETEAAAQTFIKLLKQQPTHYDGLCELGDIRLEQAAYTQALELFEHAKEADREKYRAYLGAGIALQSSELGRYKDARDNYQEVLKRDPKNEQAQVLIGQSYLDEKVWDRAIAEYEKAIALINEKADGKPLSEAATAMQVNVYVSMGQANLNQKNYKRARELFQTALKLAPANADAMQGVGESFELEGIFKDAEVNYKKAIDAAPDNPKYYLKMGLNLHKNLKLSDKALPYYLEYFKRGGNDPNVKQWIVECGGTPPQGT